jgi:ethanolamine ammonia-lyase small subunit
MTTPVRDPWSHLRQHTSARIALGRTGVSLPTRELLDFALAHAQARDAIHLPLDTDALCAELQQQGWPAPLRLHSQARDRHEYLLRPDLGRRLDATSVDRLGAVAADAPDLVLVLGDGLSALGIQQHGAALLAAIRSALSSAFFPALRLGPLVVVSQARVAVADEVGERLGAAAVAMVVGERPGLSSPDSVGIYLTHAPRVGCSDAQRNCISNVRPAGQDLETAARRLAWLLGESRRLGLSGVGLKDHSGLPLTGLPGPAGSAPGLN